MFKEASAFVRLICIANLLAFSIHTAQATSCDATVYLTFDTGNMSVAEEIASYLKKHNVKATFFVANEKTMAGGWSLGSEWQTYWKQRVLEGHAFGSHTYDHVYFKSNPKQKECVIAKPQFGKNAGKSLSWCQPQICEEIDKANIRFKQLTGSSLDPIWRAPGGHTTKPLIAAAQVCGYQHIYWSKAGFLGDELPSDKYPNAVLLDRAVNNIKDGDVLMGHLGIWSRATPFAPMIDSLIDRLKKKGFCFNTLRGANLRQINFEN